MRHVSFGLTVPFYCDVIVLLCLIEGRSHFHHKHPCRGERKVQMRHPVQLLGTKTSIFIKFQPETIEVYNNWLHKWKSFYSLYLSSKDDSVLNLKHQTNHRQRRPERGAAGSRSSSPCREETVLLEDFIQTGQLGRSLASLNLNKCILSMMSSSVKVCNVYKSVKIKFKATLKYRFVNFCYVYGIKSFINQDKNTLKYFLLILKACG